MILALDPGTRESAFVLMEETTCRPEDFALDDNRLILRRMETSPGARREEGGPAGREPPQRTGRRGGRAMRDARSRGAGSPGAADAAEETYKKWITMRRCAACGKAFATLPGYVYHLSVKGRMRWYCGYTCMRTVQRPMEELRLARMLRYQAKIAGGDEGACGEEGRGDGDV